LWLIMCFWISCQTGILELSAAATS
jgi:hypothetical protein